MNSSTSTDQIADGLPIDGGIIDEHARIADHLE